MTVATPTDTNASAQVRDVMEPRLMLGRLRRVRWFALVLTLAAVSLAACGGEDVGNGPAATPGVDDDLSADPAEGSEEIVIETRVVFAEGEDPTGEVLEGSTIGDSPFCVGGTISDQHGTEDPSVPPYGLVDRTFECPDGTLRIGFSPGVPQDGTQRGPWRIVSGTGAYEGLQGEGQMEAPDVPGSAEARETFTGTVSKAGG